MFNRKYDIDDLFVATITTDIDIETKHELGRDYYRILTPPESKIFTIISYKRQRNIKIRIGFVSTTKKKAYYDIINNNYYIKASSCDWFEIYKNTNLFYILDVTSLRKCLNLDAKFKKISKKELIDLYNELNDLVDEEEQKENKNTDDITNPFFLEILKVRENIAKSTNDQMKKIYIEKLTRIGKNYTETLISNYEQIKDNPNYELEILNKSLSLLADLELEISKNNEISDYESNLMNDFATFQSIITEESPKLKLTPDTKKESNK